MSEPFLPDALWAIVEPLLPPVPLNPKGVRPRTPDRDVLTGILFVLQTGISWERLLQELSCGFGVSCRRRLRTGRKPGSGTVSTEGCTIGWRQATGSIGRRQVWTARASGQQGGANSGSHPPIATTVGYANLSSGRCRAAHPKALRPPPHTARQAP
jgi:transposase